MRGLSSATMLAVLCALQVLTAYPLTSQPSPSGPPPGRLVRVGDHTLHLRCVGPATGGPTVVLEAGGGAYSSAWARVQELLAPTVRSCAYDRAGSGWSAPGPSPRTMHQEVFELHTLLSAAQERGPFVLVGQSIGGLLVRLYAEKYDADVAGVVLVDPTHEDEMLYNLRLARWVRIRDLATGKVVPEPKSEGAPSAAYDPSQDYFADEFQLMHLARESSPTPLGDRPLIVIGAGKRPPPPDTPDSLWNRLRVEKDGQRIDLSRLSRNSRFILDASSTHEIQRDDPRLVARSIEDVVRAVRAGSPLNEPLAK